MKILNLYAGIESCIKNKRQVLRNCVLPELGLYLFEQVNKEPSNDD